MTQRTTGRLLIAEPMLGDPNFDRTVVLVLEHTADGALGIVLNRPTEVTVASVLGEWAGLAADPPVLHLGGPVAPSGVLGLARRNGGPLPPGWTAAIDDVGTVDLHVDPATVAASVSAVRFFAGYSGWGPGQLESELAQDAWLVVDAVADDVFATEPQGMWRAVLARQRGRVSMLANFPADPSAN